MIRVPDLVHLAPDLVNSAKIMGSLKPPVSVAFSRFGLICQIDPQYSPSLGGARGPDGPDPTSHTWIAK